MSDDNVINLDERRKKKKKASRKTTAKKIEEALKRFGSHGGLVHKYLNKKEDKSKTEDKNKKEDEDKKD